MADWTLILTLDEKYSHHGSFVWDGQLWHDNESYFFFDVITDYDYIKGKYETVAVALCPEDGWPLEPDYSTEESSRAATLACCMNCIFTVEDSQGLLAQCLSITDTLDSTVLQAWLNLLATTPIDPLNMLVAVDTLNRGLRLHASYFLWALDHPFDARQDSPLKFSFTD